MRVLGWAVDKWLMQGLLTSILTGVGFLVISFTIEYVKRFRKGRQAKEQEIFLQRILCGEQVLEVSDGIVCARNRKKCVLGTGRSLPRGSVLFEQYKRAGGFLGVGQGYYSRLNEARRKFVENLQDKSMAAIVSKASWCGGPANYEGGPASSTSLDDEVTSLEWDTGKSCAATLVDYLSPNSPNSVKSDPDLKEFSGTNSNNAVIKEIRLWSTQTAEKGKDEEMAQDVDMCARALKEHPHLAPYLRKDALKAAQQVKIEKANSALRESRVANKSKEKVITRSERSPSRIAYNRKRKEGKFRLRRSSKSPEHQKTKERDHGAKQNTASPPVFDNTRITNVYEPKPIEGKPDRKLKNRTMLQKRDVERPSKCNFGDRRPALSRRESSGLKSPQKPRPLERETLIGAKQTQSDIFARRAHSFVKRNLSCASLRSLPCRQIREIKGFSRAASTHVRISPSKGKTEATGIIGKQRKFKRAKIKLEAKDVECPSATKPVRKRQASNNGEEKSKTPLGKTPPPISNPSKIVHSDVAEKEDFKLSSFEVNPISQKENLKLSSTSPKFNEHFSPNQSGRSLHLEDDENKDVVSSSISGYIRSLVFGDNQAQQGDSGVLSELQPTTPRNCFFMSKSPMTTIEEAPCGSYAVSSSNDTYKNINDIDKLQITQESELALIPAQDEIERETSFGNKADAASDITEQSSYDFFSCCKDPIKKMTLTSMERSNSKYNIFEKPSTSNKKKSNIDKMKFPLKDKHSGKNKEKSRSTSLVLTTRGEGKVQSLQTFSPLPSAKIPKKRISKPLKNLEQLDSDTSSTIRAPNAPKIATKKTTLKEINLQRESSSGSGFGPKSYHREKNSIFGSPKKRSISNIKRGKRSPPKRNVLEETLQNRKRTVSPFDSPTTMDDSNSLQNNKTSNRKRGTTIGKRTKNDQIPEKKVASKIHKNTTKPIAKNNEAKESPKHNKKTEKSKITNDSLQASITLDSTKKSERGETSISTLLPYPVASDAKVRVSKKIRAKQKRQEVASKMLDNYDIEVKKEEVLGSVVSLVTYRPKNVQGSTSKGFNDVNWSMSDQSKNCRDEIKKADPFVGQGLYSYRGSTEVEDFDSIHSVSGSKSVALCPSFEFDTDSESELTYNSKYGRYSLRLHEPNDPNKKIDTGTADQENTSGPRPFSFRPSALDDVVKSLKSQGKQQWPEEQSKADEKQDAMNPSSSSINTMVMSLANPLSKDSIDLEPEKVKGETNLKGLETLNLDKQQNLDEISSYKSQNVRGYDQNLVFPMTPQFPVQFQSLSIQKNSISKVPIYNKVIHDGDPNQENILHLGCTPIFQKETSEKMDDAKESSTPQESQGMSFYSMESNTNTEKIILPSDQSQNLEFFNKDHENQTFKPCYQNGTLEIKEESRKLVLRGQEVLGAPSLLGVSETIAEPNCKRDTESKVSERNAVASCTLGLKDLETEESEKEISNASMMRATRNLGPQKVSGYEIAKGAYKREKGKVRNTFARRRQDILRNTDEKKKSPESRDRKSPQKIPTKSSLSEERHQKKHVPLFSQSPNKNRFRRSTKKPGKEKTSVKHSETVTNLEELSESVMRKPSLHQRVCVNRTSPVKIHEMINRTDQHDVEGKLLSESESTTAEPLEEHSAASYSKTVSLTSNEIGAQPQEKATNKKSYGAVAQNPSHVIQCESSAIRPEAAKLIKALGGVKTSPRTTNEKTSKIRLTKNSSNHLSVNMKRDKEGHVFGSNANFSVESFRTTCPVSSVATPVEPDVKFSNYKLTGDHFRTYRQRKESDDE